MGLVTGSYTLEEQTQTPRGKDPSLETSDMASLSDLDNLREDLCTVDNYVGSIPSLDHYCKNLDVSAS